MVQVVTSTSWGSRLVGALLGILIGIALVFGAFYLVCWNEGHGLHVAQSLQQVKEMVVTVKPESIAPENNMRVVYLSGLAETKDVLHDTVFDISENAIQLSRQVEMYQWQEDKETKSEDKMGGSQEDVTSYTYKQVWSGELIDSADFQEKEGHQNPTALPIKSKVQYAKHVAVGAYQLPHDLIKQISGDTAVDLSHVNKEALKTKFNKPVQQVADSLYFGEDPNAPKVGDMRVTLMTVLPETVSIIAQQTDETLQPFMSKAGEEVSLIEMGKASPQEMIMHAESANRLLTWVFRLVALAMFIFGFALMMRPIVVLADVVPFFGSVVGFGTGVIACILGLTLWAIAIAVAWFAVRPLWAVGMILITFGICYLLYRHKRNKNLLKQP